MNKQPTDYNNDVPLTGYLYIEQAVDACTARVRGFQRKNKLTFENSMRSPVITITILFAVKPL